MESSDSTEDLSHAAWTGQKEEVVRLLSVLPKYSVNIKNARGQTPLYCAARQAHPEIIRTLLTVPGIDVNIQIDSYGSTALHAASVSSSVTSTECVSLLLSYGCDATIRNAMDLTADNEATFNNSRVWQIWSRGGIAALVANDYPVMVDPLEDCKYKFSLTFSLWTYRPDFWESVSRMEDIVSVENLRKKKSFTLPESTSGIIKPKFRPKNPSTSVIPPPRGHLTLSKRSASKGKTEIFRSPRKTCPDLPKKEMESSESVGNEKKSGVLEGDSCPDVWHPGEENSTSSGIPDQDALVVLSSEGELTHEGLSLPPPSPDTNTSQEQRSDGHGDSSVTSDCSLESEDTGYESRLQPEDTKGWRLAVSPHTSDISRTMSDFDVKNSSERMMKFTFGKRSSAFENRKNTTLKIPLHTPTGSPSGSPTSLTPPGHVSPGPHRKSQKSLPIPLSAAPSARMVRRKKPKISPTDLALLFLARELKSQLIDNPSDFLGKPPKKQVHYIMNLKALKKYSGWLDKRTEEFLEKAREYLRDNISRDIMTLNGNFEQFFKVITTALSMDTSGHVLARNPNEENSEKNGEKENSEKHGNSGVGRKSKKEKIHKAEKKKENSGKKQKKEKRFTPKLENVFRKVTPKPKLKPSKNSSEVKPPTLIVSDLAGYLREDNTLDATRFVENFNLQTKTNYDLLNGAEVTPLTMSMKNVISSLKIISEHVPSCFEGPMMEKLHQFRRNASVTRDILTSELDLLDGHLQFVQTVLENVHLDSFSGAISELARNWEQNGERLEAVFGGVEGERSVLLPVKVPMSNVEVELMNESDFKKWKVEYKKIVAILTKMEEAIPKKWPQVLPNLSTHTGKPPLLIRDKADFVVVLGSYHVFVTKVTTLKSEWTVLLRGLYSCLEFLGEIEKKFML